MRKWKVFLILSLGLVLAGCGLLSELPSLPPDEPPASLQASCGAARDTIKLSWSQMEGFSLQDLPRRSRGEPVQGDRGNNRHSFCGPSGGGEEVVLVQGSGL